MPVIVSGVLVAGFTCGIAFSGERSGASVSHAEQQAVKLRYDRALLLETTAETSANVSMGDLDGDGKLDLVLAKGRHWPLVDRVLLGDGRGRIRGAHDLGTVADRSYSGELADLDGDGDLDVVISNDQPDPKRVYLNDGHGHFTAGSTYGRAEWPTRNARIADLNGDGRPDIVVANRGTNSANYICLNRGGGRFDGDCIAFSREPTTTVTPADIDRDGHMDLIVPHRDRGQGYVYRFRGGSDFSNAVRTPFGASNAAFRMAEAADFNGDGVPDVAAIDERSGAWLHFGRPDGTFAPGVLIGERGAPYALAVADLDRDGSMDVIVGHIEARPSIYFNDGSGVRFTTVRFGDDQGAAYGFAVGDLDGDGLPDIAVARSDAPNVVYFADRARTPQRKN